MTKRLFTTKQQMFRAKNLPQPSKSYTSMVVVLVTFSMAVGQCLDKELKTQVLTANMDKT